MKGFQNYAGRGIAMCAEWRDDFLRFLADMGPCPANYTIERIDNDGDYTPQNCRWASRQEQARNTRRVRWLTMNGQTKMLSDWARDLGISPQTLTKRLARGWELTDALTLDTRTDQTRLTNRYLEFRGERLCVAEWAKRLHLGPALQARLHWGWSVERALSTPLRKRRKNRRK